jgi:hypothetical protein
VAPVVKLLLPLANPLQILVPKLLESQLQRQFQQKVHLQQMQTYLHIMLLPLL